MPLQIFCTISFSREEAPEDAAATEKEEDEADEFLYGQEEDEEDEEDAGATTDFVAFASSCTLHGLSHIFVEGSLGARQALWALAFLLSLSVFLYQVADRIAYYLEYHHVTLLSEEESPEMTFPAVTFCNINRVRLSQLSHEDLLYLAPLVDYEPGMELGFTPAQPGPWEEDEPLNLYGFFNRTCHQLEDMLLSCSYRGQRCASALCPLLQVFTRYGKCYTFNAGQDGKPRLITMKGGTGNGLEIMLDIQQDEYLPVWGETDETSFEAGIKVQIHSQDEPPLIDQLGFGVAPGFQTFVSCQEQRLIYLPPPWGDCKAVAGDSEFYDTYSITARSSTGHPKKALRAPWRLNNGDGSGQGRLKCQRTPTPSSPRSLGSGRVPWLLEMAEMQFCISTRVLSPRSGASRPELELQRPEGGIGRRRGQEAQPCPQHPPAPGGSRNPRGSCRLCCEQVTPSICHCLALPGLRGGVRAPGAAQLCNSRGTQQVHPGWAANAAPCRHKSPTCPSWGSRMGMGTST
uniref:Acid sensing ion channel subunit 1 n=1 Tax=Zonotrichia albicollis TaxID=44394 RepID=A0A8D2NIF8_ZONAL